MVNRVYLLELFGNIPSEILYYIRKRRECTLHELYVNIKTSKKNILRSISLLIHMDILGYNQIGKRVKYYIKETYTRLVNNPVYLKYILDRYNKESMDIIMNVLVLGIVSTESISSECTNDIRRLVYDGILVEHKTEQDKKKTEVNNQDSREKEPKEEKSAFGYNEILKEPLRFGSTQMFDYSSNLESLLSYKDMPLFEYSDSHQNTESSSQWKKHKEDHPPAESINDCLKKKYVLSPDTLRFNIISCMIEDQIEKLFTPQTRMVFCAVKAAGSTSATLKSIIQKLAHSSLVHSSGIHSSRALGIEEVVGEHLKYLAGYGAISGSFDRYQVNYDSLLNSLKNTVSIQYCTTFLGKAIGVILSILLLKGYIEDKFIQKHALLDISDCKKALFSLMSEGIVTTQMVPRTSETLSSKSFHLWCASPQKVHYHLKNCCMDRINQGYLDLFSLNENKDLITLQEYNHKTGMLYGMLERLHAFYFVLDS
ncbi:hypothetical protein NEOKW01_0678 [Nematocida sp. AWRm80]|nr:hypothetical protein NEOKW01_0678 [Nematocida sp. AWRm80]